MRPTLRYAACRMLARAFCELSGRAEAAGRRVSDRLGSVCDWLAKLGGVENLD